MAAPVITPDQHGYVSVADTAKLVRHALKEAFPHTTFYVRSRSYSGGASIDIDWMDGPTPHMVDAVVNRYKGASFDGMQDLMHYHDGEIDGRRVHFMADFIQVHREYSPAFLSRIAARVCRTYGLPLTGPDGEAMVIERVWWRAGKPTGTTRGEIATWASSAWLESHHCWFSDLIHRERVRSARIVADMQEF